MVSGRLSSARAVTISCSANRVTTAATIGRMIRIEGTVPTLLVTPFANAFLNGASAGTSPTVRTFPTWTCALTTHGTAAHAPILVRDDVRGRTLDSAFPEPNGLMGKGTALTKVTKVKGRSIAQRREYSSRKRRKKGKEGRMNKGKARTEARLTKRNILQKTNKMNLKVI